MVGAKNEGRIVFWGAEVSFARGRSDFSWGAEVSGWGAKAFLQKGAEMVGAEMVGAEMVGAEVSENQMKGLDM